MAGLATDRDVDSLARVDEDRAHFVEGRGFSGNDLWNEAGLAVEIERFLVNSRGNFFCDQ